MYNALWTVSWFLIFFRIIWQELAGIMYGVNNQYHLMFYMWAFVYHATISSPEFLRGKSINLHYSSISVTFSQIIVSRENEI